MACYLYVLTKSIRRVLYLTVIYLRQQLPIGSSDLPKTSEQLFMSLYGLAPGGVYMAPLVT